MRIEPGTCQTQSGCVTLAPPSQLRGAVVAKLFNNRIGQNVNKQSRVCSPHIVNKKIL